MKSETLHFWTYNDTPLEDLSPAELLEACNTACEEVHRLREQNARLVKLSIWAPPEWAQRVDGNA